MEWTIDPNKTGPENLASCIEALLPIFFTKPANAFNLTGDERKEVMDCVRFRAYRVFLKRLHTGRYNRNFSFYLNVRSCVMGACGTEFQMVDRRFKIVAHGPDVEDSIKNQPDTPMYYTNVNESPSKRVRRRSRTVTPSGLLMHEQTVLESEYMDLLEDSELLGREPISYQEFCRQRTTVVPFMTTLAKKKAEQRSRHAYRVAKGLVRRHAR